MLRSFLTKDIYVVQVAPITGVSGANYYFDYDIKKAFYTIITENSEGEFIDVFSEYVYVTKNNEKKWVYPRKMASIGNYMIIKSDVILKYMQVPNDIITKEELLALYAQFNSKTINCDDFILNYILELNYKIMKSDLKSGEKEVAIEKLIKLTQEYSKALIDLKDGQENSNNEYDESRIKLLFSKELIELENELGFSNEMKKSEIESTTDDVITTLKLSQIRVGK